jgi:hypothetical protein
MEMIRTARGPLRWYLKTVGFCGITLPPFGVYILAEKLGDKSLCRHEMVHWQQAQRMGTLKFYAKYLWLLVRRGYWNHPMEIEVRAAELNVG